MKATRHYATAPGDHNDFTKENEVEGDHLIQQPEYLKAYALYQSKFVEAYRKGGINISLLQFQKRALHQESMAELQLDTRFNGQLYRPVSRSALCTRASGSGFVFPVRSTATVWLIWTA